MDYPESGEGGSDALIAAVRVVNRGLFGSIFGGQILGRELKLD
jgi:hypothetical protein